MALGGVGALGCSDHCGEPPPCSLVFDIPTWCSENPGKCTTGGNRSAGCLSGSPAGCQGVDCKSGFTGVCSNLAVGIALRVPIAAFADQLVGRQQLGVTVAGFYPPAPSAHLHASLNGAPGSPLAPINGTGFINIGFDFSPFPANPTVLELSDMEDSDISGDELGIFFMDYPCYQANPRFPCPG